MTVIRRDGLVFALVAEPDDDLWIEVWRERDGASVVGGSFDGRAGDFADAVEEWFDEHRANLSHVIDSSSDVRDSFIVETAWLNRVRVTDGVNPAVMSGERLIRLPGGDYQLSNGERCWVFTPEEWVEYALTFVDHLEAGELARYVRDRVGEVEKPDAAELAELLDEVGRRADRQQEGIRRMVTMWMERCRYVLFLGETVGPLPDMPEGWQSEGERGAC